MLPNKTIYTDWHRTFPESGKGKQYPWLLDKIMQNQTQYSNPKLRKSEKAKRWQTFLDYGCGKGGTAEWLRSLIKHTIEIDLYDPGHEPYRDTPLRERYDVVYSCDVLEHIEREDIKRVLAHTQSLADANLHIIDMTPAKKQLPDGRNAHITLLDKHEWIAVFEAQEHEIEEVFPYSQPDPLFNTRDRVCIWTRRSKEYTKRS